MDVPVVSERAQRIYHDAFVIDTHNDMPTRMLDDGYDPSVPHPAGFAPGQGNTDLPRLPRIAQALLDRGYSEENVKKILGGNMLRVMTQVLGRHTPLR